MEKKDPVAVLKESKDFQLACSGLSEDECEVVEALTRKVLDPFTDAFALLTEKLQDPASREQLLLHFGNMDELLHQNLEQAMADENVDVGEAAFGDEALEETSDEEEAEDVEPEL